MRLNRNVIILLVVLGLLVGAYAFVSNMKPEPVKSDAPEVKTEKILEVQKDKITEISITNKDAKFVFEQKNKNEKEKEWVLVAPKDLKADAKKIDSIASNLSYITAEKVIEESASDLAKYGLDKPVEITVKYDGGVKTVELGNMTSTKDAYYIKEKGSNKVYTISSYTGDSLKVEKNDLRDNTLYTIKPDEVLGLSMSKAGNLVFTAKKGEESQWLLTAPIEGNADVSKLSPILEALAQNSSYQSFIDEKPSDLDKYGLKDPSYSLEFETASGKTKLLLGNEKEKGKEIYAKLADKSEVFTIDVGPLNFLDKPLKEIMEVFAYIVNIQDVTKIVVDMDGKITTSDIVTDKDDKDKDKFTVNGKDASTSKDEKDNSLFRKYYQALIGVTMDEIDAGSKPTAKAEITFTYSLKKAPGTMKVEFIPKDNNYYYVVKNGKYANILVSKKKFDEVEGVRETQKKLLDALK